jgi:DNA end-binding protein Ku
MAKAKLEEYHIEGQKSIWKGQLSISMFNMPVKIFSAISELESAHLTSLCQCGGQVGKKNICKNCQKEIAYSDIKKGYAIGKNKYLPLTEAEIEWARGENANTISSVGFVNKTAIGQLFYGKGYFLVANDRSVANIYNLLVNSLIDTQKMLLVKMALRSDSRFAVVYPENSRLVIHQLNFQDEVRDIGKVPVEKLPSSSEEMSIFRQIIDKMTISGKPDLTCQKEGRFKELIAKKLAGEPLPLPEPIKAIPQGSLLEQLRATAKALEE